MFGFIKKLFGGKPAETTAEVPYKVEQVPTLTEVVNSQPVVKEEAVAPVKAPKKKPAGKKPAGQKPAQKPAAKPAAPKQGGAKKGGRKPKSKPAV